MQKIHIDIEVVSDVVCPWCYIGKRRMEKAVEELKDKFEISITYSPFELNPDIPTEGVNQKSYLSKKFGGETRYEQLTNHVTQVAAGEGLHFDYSRQETSPNTRNAHRIIWLAKKSGRQHEVKEAFLKSYFEDGIDLTKKANLIKIAVGAGLEEASVVSLLESNEGLPELELSEKMNYQRGVGAVPFYIINDHYGISGAQPSEVFVQAFREIAEKIPGR